ncbi:hypothetical protein HNR12_005470 [Streptomonospora nanhaiensis]|uniref:Uncharacterized protein n=1 Tax=Streptomonospora nanhaiensis TaxID=1323731 RepID=A0A853BVT1_9ACTN|nr:hypothetical protein [Streptomonospora nanhaiensis]
MGINAGWGAGAFWNPPVQTRLHRPAGPLSAQAPAMNVSGTDEVAEASRRPA